MTFIYQNPWLVEQLLQAGLNSEKKLSKQGQAADPNQQQQLGDSLRALLNNLRDQITPLKGGPDQVGQTSEAADLSSHNMDSMGDMVQWLLQHGTRIGSTTIVQPGNTERPGENYGYYKIEPGTEIVVPMARPDRTVVAYWINTDALKKYLVSLQIDPKLKGNVMFQVQLLKLIQDANTQLDVSIGEQYQEPEQTFDGEVDKIPNPIDPKSTYTNGNVSLTGKDLASLDTLISWLTSKQLTMKTDAAVPVAAGDQAFDQCVFINVLNNRASNNQRWRKPGGQYYVAQMAKIAKEANCQLTRSQGQQQGGAGAASNAQLAQKLYSLEPFDEERISFPDIRVFLNTYAAYANDGSVTSTAQSLNAYMDSFKGMMSMPRDTFQRSDYSNPGRFESLLRQPTDAQNAALYLYDIIDNAGALYQRLVDSIAGIAKDPGQINPAVYRNMQSQVSSGGPQQTNLSELNRLRLAEHDEWMQNK